MLLVQFLYTPKVSASTGKSVKIVRCDSFGHYRIDHAYLCFTDGHQTYKVDDTWVENVGITQE